ncbi:T9SS type A sorting domain-containing protein [Fluviicola sp.]|uniref:T9SS type A sorting domain-containing protein n=1 Tax=Fluviicola sp. TaxID=1917219 RepID=UPI003D2C75A4
MKRLLLTAFIITSLAGFSQEKKGICSAGFHLFHESGDDSIPDDHFMLEGFSLDNPLYYGGFHIDSTIYEVTLPFGDSLLYSAYWHVDGMCYPLVNSGIVDSIITILEGVPFSIIHEGYYGNSVYYSLSQKAVIRNSCLFKIQKNVPGATAYFIRVKFQDPPIPETPLDLPEITNEISMWLSSEHTLSVKTDQDAVWDLNLYSLSGQMLQKKTLEGSQDVDVSDLPKGCYIARVSGENGLEKQLRFIK